MELTRSGKIGDNTVRGEAARGAYNTREEASLVVSLSLARARVSTDNGVFDRAMSGVPTGFDIRARTDTPIERCYTRESYRKPVLAIALHARARLAREYLSARAWSDRELFRDPPRIILRRVSSDRGCLEKKKIRSHGYNMVSENCERILLLSPGILHFRAIFC